MFKNWLENEPKETLVCAVVSIISLVLSITGVLKNTIPIDIEWIAIVLCGTPILIGAFKGVIFEHDIKADLLVSLALIASVATGEFFAAGEVALIMQIGSLLEDYTSGKANESIEKLISITPQTARVIRGKESIELPVEEVRLGDVLSVLAGETIPVDGTILEGETSIDQSVMTGESIPVDKKVGDKVSSGTMNQFGAFTMRADSLALTTSDAGIAMGGIGSDIAIESADAVLVSDEITRLPYLFSLMKKVMKKVKVNIIASLIINLSAVILSALGILTPITGAIWHNCGSVFVVINAALLLRYKDK